MEGDPASGAQATPVGLLVQLVQRLHKQHISGDTDPAINPNVDMKNTGGCVSSASALRKRFSGQFPVYI